MQGLNVNAHDLSGSKLEQEQVKEALRQARAENLRNETVALVGVVSGGVSFLVTALAVYLVNATHAQGYRLTWAFLIGLAVGVFVMFGCIGTLNILRQISRRRRENEAGKP